MVDPINYSALQSQINLAPLQQGLAMRQDNRVRNEQLALQQQSRQLAQTKFEYDQEKDLEYRTAIELYRDDPNPQALRDLAIRFPEQANNLIKAGDSYSASQKQDLVGAGFSALGALSAGKSDLAVKTLEDRVTALRNSGIDTSHTQAAIDMIESGDTKGAQAYLSYAMSGLVGADHAAGVLESLGVGARADDRRADNERAERALEIQQQRADTADRRAEAADARAERREARADAREARLARGGSTSSGNYEYRIDPTTGAVQRRRRQ